jgi:hypothetical protein
VHTDTDTGGRQSTGAGGDNGIAKMWNRREISVSSCYDQSHDLHPHPYTRAAACLYYLVGAGGGVPAPWL